MSAPSFELPAPYASNEDAPQESIGLIAVRGLTATRYLKVSPAQADLLRTNPGEIIPGFEEAPLSVDYREKTSRGDYFWGSVAGDESDDSDRERFSVTLREPGRVARGLHRAINVIRATEPPKTNVQIERRWRWAPETDKQLDLF